MSETMSSVEGSAGRIFWLKLPPLSANARIAAARTALRARVANASASEFALSTTTAANGLWCAVVPHAPQSWPADTNPTAARVPWTPATVTWVPAARPAFAISARGESITLEDGGIAGDELPEEIVALTGAHAAALSVIGNIEDGVRARWEAQLGIPVHARPTYVENALQFGLLQSLSAPLPRVATSAGTLAAWLAALAGLAHLAFAGIDAVSVHTQHAATTAAMEGMGAKFQQSSATWRGWLAKQAPQHQRDSAAGLIALAMPALAATAPQVTAVTYEANALTIEWSALTDAQRDVFERTVRDAGASVVAGGKRARVVWP